MGIMKKYFHKGTHNLWAVLFIILALALGYIPKQNEFLQISVLFIPLFLLYVYVVNKVEAKKEIVFWIGVAILVRFILLFAFPNLSDDIYRFIWDGRLIVNDINPFEQLPSYYLDGSFQIPGINQALYDELNSPNYFTIYPPVAQTVFAGAVRVAGDNLMISSIVMKSFLLACEIGSLVIIPRILTLLSLPIKNVLWYALNPLVLIEVMGNLHFEGAMVFFFLLAFYLLIKNKLIYAAMALGLSIASKLLPLMFLPTLLRRLGFKKLFLFGLVAATTVVLLFMPLISETFINNFGNSLDLYFRKFEFNGSITYLVREIVLAIEGYNPILLIGPVFPILTVCFILFEAFFRKSQSLQNWMLSTLLVFTCYLLLSMTIHPWYVIMPVAMCLFTNYRYPILWSGLIMMTYINYADEVYHENLWVVALEYVLVFGFMGWEFWKRPPFSTQVSEM
jgi:hypothetical protein